MSTSLSHLRRPRLALCCYCGTLITRSTQAKSVENAVIWNAGAILFCDYSEAAAIVPHGPSNIVVLQCRSNIFDPARPSVGIGKVSIYAELVAGERHMTRFGPLGGKPHLHQDAISIPLPESGFSQLPLRQ